MINERKVLEKMITLPEQFQKRMSEMLGTTYQEFLESYNSPRQYGLRVNTLKITPQEFQQIAPFPITPVPWISNGYFYTGRFVLLRILIMRLVCIIFRNRLP